MNRHETRASAQEQKVWTQRRESRSQTLISLLGPRTVTVVVRRNGHTMQLKMTTGADTEAGGGGVSGLSLFCLIHLEKVLTGTGGEVKKSFRAVGGKIKL